MNVLGSSYTISGMSISAAMIIKRGECENLKRCLASIRGIVSEITAVVDPSPVDGDFTDELLFEYGVKEILQNLGNYQIAWYMGLYLCVFLLIPFLNKAWYALSVKEQNILLGTLAFLCTIYPAFKYVGPSYFIGIYPVLFYYLGIAVSQRRWRANKLLLIAILVVTIALEATISMKFTTTGMFDWNLIQTADGTYGTFFISVCTICIFLTLYEVDIRFKIIRALLSAISSVSFEIYLFAGAYDAIIYGYAKRYLNGPVEAFWWFFVTVPLSFTCAFISSFIFRKAVDAILKSIQN